MQDVSAEDREKRWKILTSPFQVLNVSMSLAAHIEAASGPDPPYIHPTWEMLHPQLPTCNVVSSSSSSLGSERERRPSVDPERRRLLLVVGSFKGEKESAVISSEWVELCARNGVAGCRASLLSICYRGKRNTVRVLNIPVQDGGFLPLHLGSSSDSQAIWGHIAAKQSLCLPKICH